MKLEEHVVAEIEGYMKKVEWHESWYWYLVNDWTGCRLSHEDAYTLSVAMHADAGIPFDKVACTVTLF